MERKRLLNPAGDDAADQYQTPCWGSFLDCFGMFCGTACLIPFCGCCCNPYQTVDAGHKGVVVKFGRIDRVLDPGMHKVNPVSEKLYSVNMMLHVKALDSQEVMTKDNLPVTIDGDVFYKRTDPVRSTFSITHLTYSIDQLAHSTLRNIFGRYNLQECLAHRDEISKEIREIARDQATGWGIEITNIQIRDIKVPNHIRDMLASAATAEREAAAKLISARANVAAAKMMREAADQLNSEAAMQMRHIEMLEKIALSENSKVVFVPTEHKQVGALLDLNRQ